MKIHFDKGQVSDRPAVTFVDLPQIVNAFKYPNYPALINVMIGYNLFNLAKWWVENYYAEIGVKKTISGTPYELNDLFRMDSSNRKGIEFGNQVVKELNKPQDQPIEMTRETFEVMCSTLMNKAVSAGVLFGEVVEKDIEPPLHMKSKTASHIRIEKGIQDIRDDQKKAQQKAQKAQQEIEERANRPDRESIPILGGVKMAPAPVDVIEEAIEREAKDSEEALQRNILKQRATWEKAREHRGAAPIPPIISNVPKATAPPLPVPELKQRKVDAEKEDTTKMMVGVLAVGAGLFYMAGGMS